MAKQKRKSKLPPGCLLIQWSIKGKDGNMRPPICPRCFKPAEVILGFVGIPCYGHKLTRAEVAP